MYFHLCLYKLEAVHCYPFGTHLTMVGIREKMAENKEIDALFGIIK